MSKAETRSPARLGVVVVLLAIAAGVGGTLRLLPYALGAEHPLTPWLFNFTPVFAMLVFGVACLPSAAWGWVAPLAMLATTDVLLRMTGHDHSGALDRLAIYGVYAALALPGLWVRRKRTLPRLAAAAVAGPLGFYIITNGLVWLFGDPLLLPPNGYPKTLAGLAECYVNGLPFLRNDLLGTALFMGGLFGGYAWLARRTPALREAGAVAVG